MGWVDESDHLYLVCRSLAEKLIQECNSQGLKSLPQDPVRVYDILQEHGYALSTDDGKAIWPIRVKTASFEHKFTCLKFQARKLTLPSRPLRALEGEISIVSTDTQETFTTTQEAGLIETAVATSETASVEANKKQGEVITTADTVEPADEMPSDEDILAAEFSEEIQDSVPIRDTVEDGSANAAVLEEAQTTKPETEETMAGALETGAVAESAIGLIRNLDFEAPDTGQKFLSWLQRGLIEKTIVINNITAEVHIVDEGVFLLAPAIFKTFLRLHGVPEEKHKNLSKRFQNLRKHIRNGDVNIHPYWVSSTNRKTKINGWLLPFNVIYENDYPVPKPNKYIKKELGSGGE